MRITINKTKLIQRLLIATLLTSLSLLASCSKQQAACNEIPTLFNGKDLSAQIITRYVKATSTSENHGQKTADDVKIYVDKSSGINEAFSSAVGGKVSMSLMLEIMNNYRRAKLYSVLSELKEFNLQGVDPSNYFVNSNNYEKIDGESADLLAALNQIVGENSLSFFITDAEQFDAAKSEITNGAWAIEPLKVWISRGNSIHFWVTDYQVASKHGPSVTKHLFFMAFVPSEIARKKPFTDLVASLNLINPAHLELANTSWKMRDVQWPQRSTGLDTNLLKDGVFEKDTYIRGIANPSGSYEFMSLMLPMKREIFNVPGALAKPQVYRDLYIDLSNNDFFDVSDLEIEVNEITEDLNAYSKFEEIENNRPTIVIDPNSNEKVINPAAPYTCYYEIKGEQAVIRPEFKYTPRAKEKPLKEIFKFDEEIFSNSLKNDASKAEIGFRIHPNFNDQDPSLNNDVGYNIIRVDFKVAAFREKSVDSTLSKFTWMSLWKPGQQNTGFAKSVEQVIKTTQPQGKVVHTVFIKFIKA